MKHVLIPYYGDAFKHNKGKWVTREEYTIMILKRKIQTRINSPWREQVRCCSFFTKTNSPFDYCPKQAASAWVNFVIGSPPVLNVTLLKASVRPLSENWCDGTSPTSRPHSGICSSAAACVQWIDVVATNYWIFGLHSLCNATVKSVCKVFRSIKAPGPHFAFFRIWSNTLQYEA